MLPLSTKSTIINTMSQLSDNAIIAYIESEKNNGSKKKRRDATDTRIHR